MISAAGLVIAAAVAGTSAQGLSSVSAACQNAGAAVLAGPARACLGASALLNIAMTPANQSVVQPINDWLTSMCSQPACTTAALDAAVNTITSGCQTDLGLKASSITDIKQYMAEWYLTDREVACLQDTTAGNAFCMTTSLIDQPLRKDAIPAVFRQFAATHDSISGTITCTACNQAAYALIRPKLNDTNRGTWDNYLVAQCGSGYIAGLPETIKQTANTAPPDPQGSNTVNGALALSSGVLGTLTTALFGVAGVAVFGL